MPENGARQIIDGIEKVYYDGYWIKHYQPPVDSLSDKKKLIQSLTRRLFNHMEHGINIPGRFLDKVRAAYEAEEDPAKKRVKGAMLAGALFNRAADIFNQLVELEGCGVCIEPQNDLMRACGECLREALEYGKLVRHRNGDSGIDELWGEPFKAFVMSIEDFYESRYVKIALTMRNIDEVADFMRGCIISDSRFEQLDQLIDEYARLARSKCETLRTDMENFDVWASFVVAGERITGFDVQGDSSVAEEHLDELDTRHLLIHGVRLIDSITRARTAMPESTTSYLDLCQRMKGRLS